MREADIASLEALSGGVFAKPIEFISTPDESVSLNPK
jgi:hypothetical protein